MTAQPLILWLEEPECENNEAVGNKASILSRLRRQGLRIPQAFCVTQTFLHAARTDKRLLTSSSEFAAAFHKLIRSISSRKLIVRSSAIQEDAPGLLFPGRFLSIRDVRSFDACVDAVLACAAALESERVTSYCYIHGINPEHLRMAVIVQQQVASRYAGIAQTVEGGAKGDLDSSCVLVEFTRGDSTGVLNGTTPKYVARVEYSNDTNVLTPVAGSQTRIRKLQKLVRNVAKTAIEVEGKLKRSILLEWVFDGASLAIVQARPFVPVPSRYNSARQAVPRNAWKPNAQMLPDERVIGLKGAAMKFFVAEGWFEKRVLFHEPNMPLSRLETKIHEPKWSKDGITIRFSFGNEIGLPRRFAKDAKEAFSLFKEVWQPGWFGIIHEYMSVVRSFELFVSSDRFILEHIPGLWESENEEPPDVIVHTSGLIECLRVTKRRRAKFEDPKSVSFRYARALSKRRLADWAHRVGKYVARLRSLIEENLPVVCHFVGDENDRWQFLNIRRSGPVGSPNTKPFRMSVIRNESDIAAWDGQSPPLVKVPVPRGDERHLSALAKRLPAGCVVFVDFGVLSHPAMVLREFGLDVRPVYQTHDRFVIQGEP